MPRVAMSGTMVGKYGLHFLVRAEFSKKRRPGQIVCRNALFIPSDVDGMASVDAIARESCHSLEHIGSDQHIGIGRADPWSFRSSNADVLCEVLHHRHLRVCAALLVALGTDDVYAQILEFLYKPFGVGRLTRQGIPFDVDRFDEALILEVPFKSRGKPAPEIASVIVVASGDHKRELRIGVDLRVEIAQIGQTPPDPAGTIDNEIGSPFDSGPNAIHDSHRVTGHWPRFVGHDLSLVICYLSLVSEAH